MTDTDATDKPTKKPKKPKKPGRPKGAKTAETVVVEAAPARCRDCGATEWETLKKLPSTNFAGEHDGQPYNRIDYRRCRCRACGAVHVVRTYIYTPDLETDDAE
jgi:hypothetical protein